MDTTRLWPPQNPAVACVHWDALAGALFKKYDATPGGFILRRPVLICIRGVEPYASESHPLRCIAAYDDTFVLIQVTSMPCVFKGATHSYQADSKLSPDVNHDGRGDVGTIRPGRFVLHDTGSKPYPVFTVTRPDGSGRLPCWRDIDHDQVISDADKAFSELAHGGPQEDEHGTYSTDVLLHPGFDAPADSPHRSSISCLTLQVPALSIVRTAAKNNGGGTLDCFVVDVEDALAMLTPVPAPDEPANIS